MTFDESLKLLIEETEIPEELLPENIAVMLKEKAAAKPEKPQISMSGSTKRKAIFRSVAAVAACAALTVGVFVYTDSAEPEIIEDPAAVSDIKPIQSYSDVHSAVRDLFINSSGEIVAETTVVESASDTTGQTTVPEAQTTVSTEPDPAGAIVAVPEPESDISSKFYLTEQSAPGVDEADILKTDGINLYYIANGSLYAVSSDGGKMSLASKISDTAASPIEMYAENGKLIVVSQCSDVTEGVPPEKVNDGSAATGIVTDISDYTPESFVPAEETTLSTDILSDTVSTENMSDLMAVLPGAEIISETEPSQTAQTTAVTAAAELPMMNEQPVPQDYVSVEIYDISDVNNIRLLTKYKQCGAYTSSRMVDKSLYLVSGYQLRPLEGVEDLDNYVPTYFIDGDKNYVAAADIIVPNYANSANYTIVSGIGVAEDMFTFSTKAVLGISNNIYCSGSSLYIVGTNKKDNREYSSVTRFALADNTAVYAGSTTVDGLLVSPYSMNEYNGSFRVATSVYDEVTASRGITVYVLNGNLNVMSALSGILPNQQVESVSFENDYAYVYKLNESNAAAAVDISTMSLMSQDSEVLTARLHTYSDKYMLGFGTVVDENGQSFMTLMMFDKSGRNKLAQIKVADEATAKSEALFSRKAILIDTARNVIGIPIYGKSEFGLKNQYLIYSFSEETGFVLLNALEYNDISDKYKFNRAVFAGDALYVASNGRMVSARADNLKVIDTLDIQ